MMIKQYKRIIGKLIYVAASRPEISFDIGLLSQFMQKLREIHNKVAVKILAYIRSSLGKGFLYKNYGHISITTYSDAGYARDKGDRKSIISYLIFIGDIAKQKQDLLFRSSVEAKYRFITHTTCELLWLNNLQISLGFKQKSSILIHCNNQFAI